MFMFGRGTNPNSSPSANTTKEMLLNNLNGFLLPRNALLGDDNVLLEGEAYVDGLNGFYSATASGNVRNTRGSVFIVGGSLDVVSWLKANFQRNQTSILANARELINRFPKP
jgi:hypothetical protein